MELQFCSKVSGVGGFRGFEIANVLLSSVDLDPRLPPFVALVPRHAAEAGGAVLWWARLVLLIHAMRHIAKIGDSVVRLVAVEVIDLILRHYAIDVQPRQSVRCELHPVDHDADVAVFVRRPRDRAHLDPAATHPPTKNPGVGFVVQQGSKGFSSNSCASHGVVSGLAFLRNLSL